MKMLSRKNRIGKEHKPISKAKEITLMHLAVVIIAIGVYFFKFPNNFAIGGVSGISVVLNALIPNLSTSNINLILNIVLIFVGLLFFGKDFGLKTAYASILLSLLIELLSVVVPMSKPLTSQPFLELIYAVVLPGIGGGILFNINASSGGTDIIAMIMRKYTSMDIGKSLLASDLLVTCLSIAIFGLETGLLALLGLFTKSILIDTTIESINKVKKFTIVTEKPDEILDFIKITLHRGGTISKGQGIYLHQDKSIINVVVNNYEAILLRDFTKKADPNCFITIINTSQIIGKGFHNAS